MSYDYRTERPRLFTEENMDRVLTVLSNARSYIAESGAVKASKLFLTGDTWLSLAVLDYLVEQDYLDEVTNKLVAPAQSRVFVAGSKL